LGTHLKVAPLSQVGEHGAGEIDRRADVDDRDGGECTSVGPSPLRGSGQMLNRLRLLRWCWFSWLVGGVLPACDEADTCKSAPACGQQGKCTAGDAGKCIVGSARDCNSSELCTLHGRCSWVQGTCTAASDADCKGSQDCQKQQTCEAYRGLCVDLAKSVHAECVNRCEADGLCVMSGGKCAALSRLHCAGTMDAKPEAASPCATQGRCNAENGRCIAASNEDCARSVACKDEARCAAKDGVCVATAQDCAKSSACSSSGKCDASNGTCVASSSTACRKSARCKLEGACSAKNGACIAASSGDCQQASVCAQAKHCQAQGGVCVGSGPSATSASGAAPDKVRSTTVSGLFQ